MAPPTLPCVVCIVVTAFVAVVLRSILASAWAAGRGSRSKKSVAFLAWTPPERKPGRKRQHYVTAENAAMVQGAVAVACRDASVNVTIHWGSKALSLRRLVSELQLGMEAVILNRPTEATSKIKATVKIEQKATVKEEPSIQVKMEAARRAATDSSSFLANLQMHWAGIECCDWPAWGPKTGEDGETFLLWYDTSVLHEANERPHWEDQWAPSLGCYIANFELGAPRPARLQKVFLGFWAPFRFHQTVLRGDGQWILATWVSATCLRSKDRFGDYGLVCCAFCADLAEAVVVGCFRLIVLKADAMRELMAILQAEFDGPVEREALREASEIRD
ncbi:hypothetical protein AK812_SmicGene4767 [Symbiodinium microadriaticum]|uniref:Uncharacterized protein n=1 Tax=Symbiodinium microadriaticum TaxID=2951 RepID=A0A1Q9EVL6_SYMMI|nr:hypothetical protein AK812_SmicGene4767 [Symbiodinium microadriaticum]